MGAKNPKVKGGQFEREVCKNLSLWISEGKRDDIFWRSAMSGGRATIGAQKGINRKSQAGDISAVDQAGQKFIDNFYVECKFYKDLDFESFWFNSGRLWKFWEDAEKCSNHNHKCPLLIAKQNRRPVLVLTNENAESFFDWESFSKVFYMSKNHVVIGLFSDFIKLELSPFL